MKSRRRYPGVLVGFVNVNVNEAKYSLVTASCILTLWRPNPHLITENVICAFEPCRSAGN
jgi:hypothetical protein